MTGEVKAMGAGATCEEAADTASARSDALGVLIDAMDTLVRRTPRATGDTLVVKTRDVEDLGRAVQALEALEDDRAAPREAVTVRASRPDAIAEGLVDCLGEKRFAELYRHLRCREERSGADAARFRVDEANPSVVLDRDVPTYRLLADLSSAPDLARRMNERMEMEEAGPRFGRALKTIPSRMLVALESVGMQWSPAARAVSALRRYRARPSSTLSVETDGDRSSG